MTPGRSPYDDLAGLDEMRADGAVIGHRLDLQRAVRLARRPAPSRHVDEQPRHRPERDLTISEAAARLAGVLYE